MKVLPKEPSVAGFMLLSFLYSLALCPLPPGRALLAVALLLLHLFTFDETFRRVKVSIKRALPFLILNAVPYLVLPFFMSVNAWVLAVPALLLLCYFCLKSDYRAYVVGSTVPTLTAFTVFYLAPKVTVEDLFFWYALAVHVSATAAYIESKLPWRDVSPRTGLAIWLLAFPLLVLKPALLAAFIEPTVKFLRNALKDGKIRPNELKKLGWTEMARFILYSTLLLIMFKFF